MHNREGAHVQCTNNNSEKFGYKGTKTVGVTEYKTQTQSKRFEQKMTKFKTIKMKKLGNVHKMGGAHLQCVNFHYAKIEYKGMNTVGVTYYTNYASPKHFGWKNGYAERKK